MRLVLDTNVLLAAFVARGVCHELVEHCQREHHLVSSTILLEEFREKLIDKFKVPPEKAEAAGALLREQMELVSPTPFDPPLCRDPDDDWVLATALDGRCTCIVTGDKDLLILERVQDVQIVAPSAFWRFEATQ